MSKATKWVVDAHEAKEHAARLARERPKLRVDGILAAEVGEAGECIFHLVSTGSDRALQIAKWIIDTFGEPDWISVTPYVSVTSVCGFLTIFPPHSRISSEARS